MVCVRCGQTTPAWTTSMFNLDAICMDCKEAERKHPMYDEAEAADVAAMRQGNFNFVGIGLPADLRRKEV